MTLTETPQNQALAGVVSITLRNWQTYSRRLSQLLGELSNEQLQRDVAPGRNSGLYLLGHLIAINDGMLALFDLGSRQFPELDAVFAHVPDKTVGHQYTPRDLREKWEQQVAHLSEQFDSLTTADWLDRHTAVSPEEFAQQPHRNRLSVLQNRTTHLAYHTGQLALLR